MKKEIKIILTIVMLVVIGFLISSRHVKQENFNLIVSMEINDVFDKCNARIKNNLPDSLDLDFNDSLYNHYIDRRGIGICLCKKDSIRKVVEKDIRESIENNWKFVY